MLRNDSKEGRDARAVLVYFRSGVVSFTDPPVLIWTRPINYVVDRPGVPFTTVSTLNKWAPSVVSATP